MKKGLMELSVLFLVALIGWVDADFPWKNLRLRRDEFHFTRYHAGGLPSKPPKTCCFTVSCWPGTENLRSLSFME